MFFRQISTETGFCPKTLLKTTEDRFSTLKLDFAPKPYWCTFVFYGLQPVAGDGLAYGLADGLADGVATGWQFDGRW